MGYFIESLQQLKLSLAESPASQPSVVAVDATKPFKRLTGVRAQIVSCEPINAPRRGNIALTLNVTPPPGCHWTEGADSVWQVVPGEPGAGYTIPSGQPTKGSIVEGSAVVLTLATSCEGQSAESSLQVEVLLYYCEDSGLCHMKGAVLHIPLVFSSTAGDLTATISYSPELPRD